MKYLGISPKDAVKDQRDMAPGLATFLFRHAVKLQIRALQDHIKEQPCSQDAKFCVQEKDNSPSPEAPAQPGEADDDEA
jgi:hypothetical protein